MRPHEKLDVWKKGIDHKEFAHFLANSQGSASEVETELLIASRLGYVEASPYRALRSSLDEIGRMLTGLCQHLDKKDR